MAGTASAGISMIYPRSKNSGFTTEKKVVVVPGKLVNIVAV
jgi:hypothetical protein